MRETIFSFCCFLYFDGNGCGCRWQKEAIYDINVWWSHGAAQKKIRRKKRNGYSEWRMVITWLLISYLYLYYIQSTKIAFFVGTNNFFFCLTQTESVCNFLWMSIFSGYCWFFVVSKSFSWLKAHETEANMVNWRKKKTRHSGLLKVYLRILT